MLTSLAPDPDWQKLTMEVHVQSDAAPICLRTKNRQNILSPRNDGMSQSHPITKDLIQQFKAMILSQLSETLPESAGVRSLFYCLPLLKMEQRSCNRRSVDWFGELRFNKIGGALCGQMNQK
jgi:hypothetical protein